MFNNLIESSSHRSEFKRRGSFVLFTVASYAIFFVIAGVVSIHAYDARMADQDLELVTMMPLVDLPAPVQPTVATPSDNGPKRGNKQTVFERVAPIARVDNPLVTPDKVSTTPNPSLPLPKGGVVEFTGRDIDPSHPGGSGSPTGSGNSAGSNPVVISEIPPPPAIQRSVPRVIRKEVINGEAISLPKPAYPQLARQLRIQGRVSIQVLVDETGKVVSARPISGDRFLVSGAQSAAYQARFSPTLIGDQPVKVSGVITYNFVLQP